jgi:hypothetical protein
MRGVRTAGGTAAATDSSNRTEIIQQARTFLSAYLAYEVGKLNRHLRPMLAAAATAPLDQSITRTRITLSSADHIPKSRLISLQLVGGLGVARVRVSALIDHAGWFSRLLLTLTQSEHRWLVSHLS